MSFDDIRKKLDYEGAEDESSGSDAVSQAANTSSAAEGMQVYLRVRPFTQDDTSRGNRKSAIEVVNKTKISLRGPKDGAAANSNVSYSSELVNTFTFTEVYDDTTTQQGLFDSSMLPTVKHFLAGHDCLVFAYGMTNSGKTFTMQGTPKDPGIIPRSLAAVFSSLEGRLYQGMDLKPKLFADVAKLLEKEVAAEILAKSAILNVEKLPLDSTFTSQSSFSTTHGSQLSSPSDDETGAEPTRRQMDDPEFTVTHSDATKYSIWLSFVEIYNEQLYDLFEPMPNKPPYRRKPLKMAEDKNGQPYVKDLRSVCACSADDANRLVTAGQKNLQYACTRLNESSSRSHCVLTIRLLHIIDGDGECYDSSMDNNSLGQLHVMRINTLSFCDLAGSERCSRTQSAGERLKEAGCINVSMLTLGRCIAALRDAQQQHGRPRGLQPSVVVPFRESKLTRLFQNFFCGKGKVSMFVNVSQCQSDYDENLHALKFSAVAQESAFLPVKPEFKIPAPKRRKSSRLLSLALSATLGSARPSIPWATPGTIAALGEVGLKISTLMPEDIHLTGLEEEEQPDKHLLEKKEPAVPSFAAEPIFATNCNELGKQSTANDDVDGMVEDDVNSEDETEDELIHFYLQREEQYRTAIEELTKALCAARQEVNELKQKAEVHERNVRAEICAAWKEDVERLEERHRRRLEEEREAAQLLMDKKVGLIEDFVHKSAMKRGRWQRRRNSEESSSDEGSPQPKMKRACSAAADESNKENETASVSCDAPACTSATAMSSSPLKAVQDETRQESCQPSHEHKPEKHCPSGVDNDCPVSADADHRIGKAALPIIYGLTIDNDDPAALAARLEARLRCREAELCHTRRCLEEARVAVKNAEERCSSAEVVLRATTALQERAEQRLLCRDQELSRLRRQAELERIQQCLSAEQTTKQPATDMPACQPGFCTYEPAIATDNRNDFKTDKVVECCSCDALTQTEDCSARVIADLEGEVTALTHGLQTCEMQREAAESQLASQILSCHQMSQRLADAEKRLQDHGVQAASKDAQVAMLEGRLAAMRADADSIKMEHESALQIIYTEVRDQQRLASNLAEQLCAAKKENCRLKDERDAALKARAESDGTRMLQKAREQQQKIDHQEALFDQATNRINHLSDQLAHTSQQLKDSELQCTVLNEKLLVAESSLSSLLLLSKQQGEEHSAALLSSPALVRQPIEARQCVPQAEDEAGCKGAEPLKAEWHEVSGSQLLMQANANYNVQSSSGQDIMQAEQLTATEVMGLDLEAQWQCKEPSKIICRLKTELTSKCELLAEAERCASVLRAELASQRELLEESKCAANALRAELTERCEELRVAKSSASALRAELTSQSDELREANSSASVFRAEMASQSEQLKVAEGSAIALRAELALRSEELRQVENCACALRAEMASQQDQLKGAESSANALRDELVSLREQLKEAESSASALRTELISQREQLRVAESFATAFRAEMTSQQEQLKEAESSASALRTELISHREQLRLAESSATAFRAEMTSQQEQLKEAESSVNALRTELMSCCEQLRVSESSAIALRAEMASQQEQLKEAESSANALRAELTSHREQLREAESSANALRTELEFHRDQLTIAECAANVLKAEVASQQDRLKETASSADVLRGEPMFQCQQLRQTNSTASESSISVFLDEQTPRLELLAQTEFCNAAATSPEEQSRDHCSVACLKAELLQKSTQLEEAEDCKAQLDKRLLEESRQLEMVRLRLATLEKEVLVASGRTKEADEELFVLKNEVVKKSELLEQACQREAALNSQLLQRQELLEKMESCLYMRDAQLSQKAKLLEVAESHITVQQLQQQPIWSETQEPRQNGATAATPGEGECREQQLVQAYPTTFLSRTEPGQARERPTCPQMPIEPADESARSPAAVGVCMAVTQSTLIRAASIDSKGAIIGAHSESSMQPGANANFQQEQALRDLRAVLDEQESTMTQQDMVIRAQENELSLLKLANEKLVAQLSEERLKLEAKRSQASAELADARSKLMNRTEDCDKMTTTIMMQQQQLTRRTSCIRKQQSDFDHHATQHGQLGLCDSRPCMSATSTTVMNCDDAVMTDAAGSLDNFASKKAVQRDELSYGQQPRSLLSQYQTTAAVVKLQRLSPNSSIFSQGDDDLARVPRQERDMTPEVLINKRRKIASVSARKTAAKTSARARRSSEKKAPAALASSSAASLFSGTANLATTGSAKRASRASKANARSKIAAMLENAASPLETIAKHARKMVSHLTPASRQGRGGATPGSAGDLSSNGTPESSSLFVRSAKPTQPAAAQVAGRKRRLMAQATSPLDTLLEGEAMPRKAKLRKPADAHAVLRQALLRMKSHDVRVPNKS